MQVQQVPKQRSLALRTGPHVQRSQHTGPFHTLASAWHCSHTTPHGPPPAPLQVNQKLADVLDSKNALIRALQYDVAKLAKAHNDLIRVYEAKLQEFGVPPEDLGFRPLATRTTAGPAGLVAGR